MRKQFTAVLLAAAGVSIGCDKTATETAVPAAPTATAVVPAVAAARTASVRVTPAHKVTKTAASKPDTTADQPLTLVLETKDYLVTVVDDRQEGDVTSDTVKYHCVSKKSGHRITLKGSTLHHMTPDGSPGQFLGYIFKNDDTTYTVYRQGEVTVTRGEKTLVDEKGKWVGEEP